MGLIYIGMDTDALEADFKKFLIDRQQRELKSKEIIDGLDKLMVVERHDISNIFEIHNFHQPMAEIHLEPQVKHGDYLKFRKRNKRKNLKVSK